MFGYYCFGQLLLDVFNSLFLFLPRYEVHVMKMCMFQLGLVYDWRIICWSKIQHMGLYVSNCALIAIILRLSQIK